MRTIIMASLLLLASTPSRAAAHMPKRTDALDLAVCIMPGADDADTAKFVEKFAAWNGAYYFFRLVLPVQSAAEAGTCDVLIKLTVQTSQTKPVTRLGIAEVSSARTGRFLLKTEGKPGWTSSWINDVEVEIRDRFKNDTALYAAVIAERSPAAAAPTARAEAAPVPEKKAAEPVSDVDAPSYHGAERPDDFALIVGIGKYRDLPEAQYAERDAAAVKKHLLAMGYPERNIISLIGNRATKSTLTDKLETWLPMNVKPDTNVFFYYSGHGAPDAAAKQAYLVPWDGDPEALEGTAYPIKRLYEKLSALKVRGVIAALDSCFSGAGGRSVLAKGARPLVTQLDTASLGAGKVIAFTASKQDQISGALDEQGHGAFTYYFLRGLNGAAKDESGAVTARSLYDYLVPNVQDEAHRHEREQTPQLLPAGASGDVRLR